VYANVHVSKNNFGIDFVCPGGFPSVPPFPGGTFLRESIKSPEPMPFCIDPGQHPRCLVPGLLGGTGRLSLLLLLAGLAGRGLVILLFVHTALSFLKGSSLLCPPFLLPIPPGRKI
jgi:hypothetical protein